MGRATGFLILAIVLLLHCLGLLSAAGGQATNAAAKEINAFARAAGGDARGLNAAPANDGFLDGRGKKHRSQSKKGRKVNRGKLAVIGTGFSTIQPQKPHGHSNNAGFSTIQPQKPHGRSNNAGFSTIQPQVAGGDPGFSVKKPTMQKGSNARSGRPAGGDPGFGANKPVMVKKII